MRLCVTQDKEKIELGVRKAYPPFKDMPAKNFSYAFKIRVRKTMFLRGPTADLHP